MLLISGDNMKKLVTAKQKHRFTKKELVMFHGLGEFIENIQETILYYTESNNEAEVEVHISDEGLVLKRSGEAKTSLSFLEGKQTTGVVSNEYGDLDIYVYTHKYIRSKNVIAIEYDIVSEDGNEVFDGFRVMWKINDEHFV